MLVKPVIARAKKAKARPKAEPELRRYAVSWKYVRNFRILKSTLIFGLLTEVTSMITNGEEIKRELYKSYLILASNLFRQSLPEGMPHLGTRKQRFLIGSVTFIAFAMESFINDFGNKYVHDFEDLERMETLTKFLLFPKLSESNPTNIIPKGGSEYKNLKKLFQYRNLFVHYKPAFRNNHSLEERLLGELNHNVVRMEFSSSVRIIKLFNGHFGMFQEGDDWITDYSTDIEVEI